MRVTTKGQATIPSHIREKLNITLNSEVDFLEKGGKVYLTKIDRSLKYHPQKNKESPLLAAGILYWNSCCR